MADKITSSCLATKTINFPQTHGFPSPIDDWDILDDIKWHLWFLISFDNWEFFMGSLIIRFGEFGGSKWKRTGKNKNKNGKSFSDLSPRSPWSQMAPFLFRHLPRTPQSLTSSNNTSCLIFARPVASCKNRSFTLRIGEGVSSMKKYIIRSFIPQSRCCPSLCWMDLCSVGE